MIYRNRQHHHAEEHNSDDLYVQAEFGAVELYQYNDDREDYDFIQVTNMDDLEKFIEVLRLAAGNAFRDSSAQPEPVESST